MRHYFLPIIFMFLGFQSQASEMLGDTIKQKNLRAAEVFSDRLNQFSDNPSALILKTDSQFQKQSSTVADLLNQSGVAFIKNYGPGQIATLSMRGGSAQQTAILWNGLSMAHPGLGLVDFSYLPSGFFNQVDVLPGVGGNLGNAAITGAINLKNHARFDEHENYTASTMLGSFGFRQTQIGMKKGNEKWSFDLNGMLNEAQNDFNYSTQFGSRKQNHAAFRGLSLMGNFHVLIRKRSTISLGFWHQTFDRQIPATLVEFTSNATQQDLTNRAYVNFSTTKNRWSINARNGFQTFHIDYNNPLNQIFDITQTHQLINEVEFEFKRDSIHLFQFGMSHQYQWLDRINHQTIQKIGAFVTYSRQLNKHYQFSATARQEVFNGQLAPFIPQISLLRFLPLSNLSWELKTSRIFRFPTLNDLYWPGQGNPNLKPETGYHAEWSTKIKIKRFNYFNLIEIQASHYHTWLENMIQWLPQSGFWTPLNKNQVWIKGVDLRLKAIKKIKQISIESASQIQWVSSQNIDPSPENTSEYRKQLMYVPQWQQNYSLGLRYRKSFIEWQSQFTGIRNTTSDGLNTLPAFWLHHFRMNQNFQRKKIIIQAFVSINNLFNKNYQVVAFRAMPMRNFQTGIQIRFNNK